MELSQDPHQTSSPPHLNHFRLYPKVCKMSEFRTNEYIPPLFQKGKLGLGEKDYTGAQQKSGKQIQVSQLPVKNSFSASSLHGLKSETDSYLVLDFSMSLFLLEGAPVAACRTLTYETTHLPEACNSRYCFQPGASTLCLRLGSIMRSQLSAGFATSIFSQKAFFHSPVVTLLHMVSSVVREGKLHLSENTESEGRCRVGQRSLHGLKILIYRTKESRTWLPPLSAMEPVSKATWQGPRDRAWGEESLQKDGSVS